MRPNRHTCFKIWGGKEKEIMENFAIIKLNHVPQNENVLIDRSLCDQMANGHT